MKLNSRMLGLTFLAAAVLSINGVDAATTRKMPETQEKETIGLALPGGSFTAATTGAAIMRGFYQQTIMIDGEEKPALDIFDYVSGLSGGNIPNIQFAYANGISSDDLLDANGINDPQAITNEELDTIPDNSMFKTYTVSTIPNIFNSLIGTTIFGISFYPSFIHAQTLEPLGVTSETSVDKLRSEVKYTPVVETCMVGPAEFGLVWLYNVMNIKFSSSNANLPDILNPVYQENGTDFYEHSPDVTWDHAKKAGFQVAIPAVITPDTFSIPLASSELHFDDVEGNKVTSVDFSPVSVDPQEMQPESEGIFTVKKMLGLGTNAAQIIGATFPDEFPFNLITPLVTPMLVQDVPTADGETKLMAFTDGGSVDGSGIPALVGLKTRHIIFPLMATDSREAISTYGPVDSSVGKLTSFFGIFGNTTFIPLLPEYPFGSTFAYGTVIQSHVFRPLSNGVNQLIKFRTAATRLHEAGEPIVVTLENLETVENKFWGIEAGEAVDLTIIVILDVPKKFSELVSRDVAAPTENGFFTEEDLMNVPNLISSGVRPDVEIPIEIPWLNVSTSFPVPGAFELSVNPRGCKMTYVMLSWIIKHSWEGLQDSTNETVFGGFKRILENDGDSVNTTSDKTTSSATVKSVSMMLGTMMVVPFFVF